MLSILRKQLPSRLRPAPYTYDTLPSNEQDPYIRLLALIPSRNQSSRLKGSLQHYRLNEVDGGYEAVSYEWGSPSPGNLTAGGRRSIPRTIVIDGKSLRITDNLFQCLLQLRSGGNLFLWIDAICINQTNGEERTSQVAIMGRIYSCALRTLSWLGRPVDFDDRISMDDSRAEAVLDFYRREAGRLRASSHECESSRPNLQTECQKVAIAQLSEGFSGVEICIIEKFFGLSYFTRRWVVQEIALAREVQLIWGASRLAWDDFILVATRVDLSDKECIGPLVHTYINGEKPCPRRSNVLWLMRTFERTECGDPIDRIAALQGLWRGPKNISRLFSVDYNESVESNYIRFAKLLVHLRLFGELLLCAVLGTGSTTVPSWVPDWRHQRFWDDRPDNVYDQWEPALPLSLGSEDTLLSYGWIVDEVTGFEDNGDGDPRLQSVTGHDLILPHLPLLGHPTPGDKVCMFSCETRLQGPQFVIREMLSNPGSYKLVTMCSTRYGKPRQAEDLQGQCDSNLVEIILV